jgi:hypothetical protein
MKKGDYFAYVMESAGDEADTYTLVEWEVLSGSNCYEAVVMLYYAPVNPYATLLKYKPAFAEEYRRENPWEFPEELEILEKSLMGGDALV